MTREFIETITTNEVDYYKKSSHELRYLSLDVVRCDDSISRNSRSIRRDRASFDYKTIIAPRLTLPVVRGRKVNKGKAPFFLTLARVLFFP